MGGSGGSEGETLYDRLGVSPNASSDDVVAAYRASVRLYHPDVSLEPDAEATMVRLNEAFAILRDPQRRADYDLTLRPTTAGSAAAEPARYAESDAPRRRRSPGFGIDDVWQNQVVPDFARAERRRQSSARELRSYWRSQTEEAPLGFIERIGVMLVVPVFIAVVILLARVLR